MGNCIITRKGNISNSGEGPNLNYVDNNQGIQLLSPYPLQQGFRIENHDIVLTQGESITAEICLKIDSSTHRTQRYFEIGYMKLILSDEWYSNAHYIECAIGGDNWYGSREILQLLDQDITLSLVINENNTKIYRNGILILTIDDANNTNLVNTSNTILYIMDASTSSRYCPGFFYAFRFYNKALTDEEILQNYQEDNKLLDYYHSLYN